MKEMTPEQRWADLEELQKYYARFETLLYDVITELLGFNCTALQIDIAKFLELGPAYKMIQAQRGQAKTTITAIYAVWRLIHNPRTRILIVSAGSDLASEIAGWVIQIIENMPELECLRPDMMSGDRSSVKAFDIHHDLKGAEKSPSIACIGITSNISGRRADVLIADDIESQKNSQTAVMRARLLHLTREFASICSNGDIIYLGTPQSNDSVYNSLPSRGFTIRVWPGRYPTVEEMSNYGPYLAPMLVEHIKKDPSLQKGGGPLLDRGQPTDPELLGEEALCKKELDQGAAYFQLQHMLDTKLMDEDRYPLKTRNLVFFSIPKYRCPLNINWVRSDEARIHPPSGFPLQELYYKAIGTGEEFSDYTGTHMYVDPAGGGKNGDELAWAVTKFLAGNVFLCDVGGIPGGYTQDKLDTLTNVAVLWKPDKITVEENFGHGAFRNIWQPTLLAKHRCALEEIYESGQKELRIIDTLEPLISSGRLIVEPDLIRKDWDTVQRYSADRRATYSFFFQLARLTRDRGSLMHDDRIDAVAGSCRNWVEALVLDKNREIAKVKQRNWEQLIKNPLGNGRPVPGFNNQEYTRLIDRLRKR